MKTYTKEELREILNAHQKWLSRNYSTTSFRLSRATNGRHWVGDTGLVFSILDSSGKPRSTPYKLKQQKMKNGYVTTRINPRRFLTHRLVAHEFLNLPLDSKLVVHHKNSNRSDNRLINIEVVSTHQNAKYSASKRVETYGEVLKHLKTFSEVIWS